MPEAHCDNVRPPQIRRVLRELALILLGAVSCVILKASQPQRDAGLAADPADSAPAAQGTGRLGQRVGWDVLAPDREKFALEQFKARQKEGFKTLLIEWGGQKISGTLQLSFVLE